MEAAVRCVEVDCADTAIALQVGIIIIKYQLARVCLSKYMHMNVLPQLSHLMTVVVMSSLGYMNSRSDYRID